MYGLGFGISYSPPKKNLLWSPDEKTQYVVKGFYNCIVMDLYTVLAETTQDVTPGVVTLDLTWASDVLAIIGILGALSAVAAMWIRHEVKKNLSEIKAEFKPNGGGSLKDQVNRLERKHESLDTRVIVLDEKVDKIINFLWTGKKSD